MRQGNSNKRMRGRGGGGGGGGGGNGGRKGPNPLSRSYESAGPENTKIRGTALHVAEKYVSLARDAQSSGDPVLAENFLQHAEHYYRIIAAAQATMPQPMPIVRSDIQSDDDFEDEDETGGEAAPVAAPQPQAPRFEQRWERNGERGDRGERDRGERRDRGDRDRGDRPMRRPVEVAAEGGDDMPMSPDAPQPFLDDLPVERIGGEDRPRGERPRRGFRSGPRSEGPRAEGGRFEGRPPRERSRGEGRDDAAADAPALDALPAFLTAAPRPAAVAAPAPVVASEGDAAEADGDAAPRRRTRGGRGRGRRPEYEGGEAAAAGEATVPASE